jgi:hypothetical protein
MMLHGHLLKLSIRYGPRCKYGAPPEIGLMNNSAVSDRKKRFRSGHPNYGSLAIFAARS